MISKLKIIVLALLTPLMIISVTQPTSAFSIFGDACKGSAANSSTCQQAGSEGSDSNNRITGPKNIISIAANLMAVVTGITAVIMIIISGLTLVTSGGNTEAAATARRRIIAAVAGLVIVALAWLLVRFVIDNLI